MIAPETVQEVRRLLTNENLSHRRIAALTGVSRGTVGAIDAGTRPDYDVLLQDHGDDPDEPAGSPERCPGCGGLVYMPCILCNVRNKAIEKPKQTFRGMKIEHYVPLEIDLRPEHQARYMEVFARKRESVAS